jgi:hypothetical protein
MQLYELGPSGEFPFRSIVVRKLIDTELERAAKTVRLLRLHGRQAG